MKIYMSPATAKDAADCFGDTDDEEDILLMSVYLVEPRRLSSAVLKFSGTIGQQNRNNKRSTTMTAFSHFVLHNTACQYMFADIQGKLCIISHIFGTYLIHLGSMDRDEHNRSALVLFDPMTHTTNSYVDLFLFLFFNSLFEPDYSGSGLGDHGLAGFQDFISDHKCNPHCRNLGLSSNDVLQATLNSSKKQHQQVTDIDEVSDEGLASKN
jgi:hypothetical protein